MTWEIIHNKLQNVALKPYSHVELMVNDMHIIAKREIGRWQVKVLHEEKDTKKGRKMNTASLVDYLNAYIATARTQIKLMRE